MKWTLRLNRTHMLTMRITHHISFSDLAIVLSAWANDQIEGDEDFRFPIMSLKAGEDLMRERLTELGTDGVQDAYGRMVDDLMHWGHGVRLKAVRAYAILHIRTHYGIEYVEEVQW